ncbi:MAG TPA: phosphoribosyltransferase [Myxococcales bacterium]
MVEIFEDRRAAGRQLAKRLAEVHLPARTLVLALPRGGVPVAFEIAQALDLPLDVFLVRKLGVPGQEELAMGALATGGIVALNRDLVRILGIPQETLERVALKELAELERRERAFRQDRPPLERELASRPLVLVDDGLATGSTMLAAVEAVRRHGPSTVVVAVPVAPRDVCERLTPQVQDLICLETPEDFASVGSWYRDFHQVTDDEVRSLLARARRPERAEA